MWPTSTSPAAKALGVTPDKLRRWLREGRFDNIDGVAWIQTGFQRRRSFTRSWIEKAAEQIGVTPDFSHIETSRD